MERSTKYPPDPSDPPEVKVQVTPPALTQFVDPQVSAFAAPAKQNATANIAANTMIFFINESLAVICLDLLTDKYAPTSRATRY